jgi:RNA polymerase sigma-70 factor (ECF subfamily)
MTAQPTTDAIWSHLSSDLRRFIRRRVPDDHVADDLLQETFVRVHRSVGTLKAAEQLAAWVYQIARNVIRDHHRKKSNSVAPLADPETLSDQGTDDPQCGRGPTWLKEMIQSLPATYRDAVLMAEIEGLSHQNVADRLGLSLSAANSRIQRGRVLLKDILEDCCSFELDGRGRVMGCDPKPSQKTCRDCGE